MADQSELMEHLKKDFENQFGDIDTMFLSLPDTMPVAFEVSTKSSLAINGAKIGTCTLISKNQERELFIEYYLRDLLPSKFIDEKYTPFDDYLDWEKKINIKVLR